MLTQARGTLKTINKPADKEISVTTLESLPSTKNEVQLRFWKTSKDPGQKNMPLKVNVNVDL